MEIDDELFEDISCIMGMIDADSCQSLSPDYWRHMIEDIVKAVIEKYETVHG